MKRVLFAIVLLAILVLTVAAQPIGQRDKWEYALMLADVGAEEYTLVTSEVYGMVDAQTAYEQTQELWDGLGGAGGNLVDYLAVMGLSGFELVSVELIGKELAYHFKRPLSDIG